MTFVGELTSVVRDNAGEIVEGSQSEIKRQRDTLGAVNLRAEDKMIPPRYQGFEADEFDVEVDDALVEELRGYLRQHLAGYKAPKAIFDLSEIGRAPQHEEQGNTGAGNTQRADRRETRA